MERQKLFPTDVGMLVTDFLLQNFESVMDYKFTAEIEKEFDDISNGEKEWHEMIDDFYKPFQKNVKTTMDTAGRVTGERELGTDPKSGKQVTARMARYGPVIVLKPKTEDEQPIYVGLRKGMNLETVTLEDALQLLQLPKLPREVGMHEGKEVKIGEGRFGPYVLYDSKYFSLRKDQDPYTITLQEALQVMAEKGQQVIKEFKENGVSVLNGRWGPYVKSGKLNAKIPADKKPEMLTLEECMELLEKAKDRPRGNFRFRKRADS
jgi:DNA topoisomerase-1